jgi:hypothetical protein
MNITQDRLVGISRQLGIRWPSGSPLTSLCPNGHDANHVGYVNGACGKCRAAFPLPDHIAQFDGKLAKRWCRKGHDTRVVGRYMDYGKSWCKMCRDGQSHTRNRKAEKANRMMSPDATHEEYLRLRDLRWMTPQAWLRDEIDERIKKLLTARKVCEVTGGSGADELDIV